jgi:hypothetical protein
MKDIKALTAYAFGRVCDAVAITVKPRMDTNRAKVQDIADDYAGDGYESVIWLDWYYLYFRYVHFYIGAGLLFYQPSGARQKIPRHYLALFCPSLLTTSPLVFDFDYNFRT